MPSTTATISTLAGEAYDWFETHERSEDDVIWTLKDEAPEWIRDLVYAAHGDFMPDDWRYDAIHSALGAIHDSGAETVDDLDDTEFEFADQNVDIYTAARFAWLSSNLNRQSYCDQAREEGLAGDGVDIAELAGLGQYQESSEVFHSVRASLAERLEDQE